MVYGNPIGAAPQYQSPMMPKQSQSSASASAYSPPRTPQMPAAGMGANPLAGLSPFALKASSPTGMPGVQGGGLFSNAFWFLSGVLATGLAMFTVAQYGKVAK